jgi:hypothetical protein
MNRPLSSSVMTEAEAFSKVDSVWALDILLAVTILLILNALALMGQSQATFKAKATEGLALGMTQRMAIMEHFALTGDWLESDVGLQDDVASAGRGGAAQSGDAGDAQDRAMRGQISRKDARSEKSGGRRETDALAQRGETQARTTTGIAEGVIVALGNYPGHDGVSMYSIQPAVPDGPEHPVVQWLCGRTPVPAGWRSPLAAAPTNLPDELLFSVCRGRKP